MSAYYNRDGYGEGSGSVRYRGRGRGGFGQAGRESGSGGGRGYVRGGSRHGGERYNKWNEGGGRHGGSGGYRESNYGQSRFRDGPGSSWSGSGYGHFKERGVSSELHRSLSHLRGRESKIAMNILNAVLAADSSGMSGRDRWDNGPPARKMRRMDWDGVRSPPMHRDPQRERPLDPRKMKGYRGISGYARGPLEYRRVTQTQLREMEMARLEMPRPEKKESKDSEKKTSATEAKQVNQDVKEGEQERATAEGDSPPAEADVKQSDPGDTSKETVPDVDMKDAESEDKKKVKQKDEVTRKIITAPESNEEPSVVIPQEALKCNMCDITKFVHTKAYLSHLKSKSHEMMSRTFHNRNAAIIDVLMIDSKLASKWKQSKKGESPHCLKCLCFLSTTIQEHCQTTEHTLVSQYSRVGCCGNKYNRAILEEHRLSLRHLKNQWDIDQETRARDQKKEQEEERLESESFHDEVYNFKKSNESEELLMPDTLPPYDATKPIGLNFLYKETLYRCDMCRSHLRNPQHAEYHFRSVEHYFSLCRHITAEEEKKELERKKLEDAMKEEEESKAKEENGDENDNCEDMNNMETVDEALEDVDGDALAAAAAADTQGSPSNKKVDAGIGNADVSFDSEAVSSEDIGEGLERSIDSEEQMVHDKENEQEDEGDLEEDNEWSGENDQDDAAEGEELVLNSNADGGEDEEEAIDEEGLDYEPGVGV